MLSSLGLATKWPLLCWTMPCLFWDLGVLTSILAVFSASSLVCLKRNKGQRNSQLPEVTGPKLIAQLKNQIH